MNPIATLELMEIRPNGERRPIRAEVGAPRHDERGSWACPVLLLTVFLLAVQAGLAADLTKLREDNQFPAKDIPKEWGRATNGLCCAIRIPGSNHTLADGLPLELFFKNVGDRTVLLTNPYDLRDEPWIWTLSISGPRGPVAYRGGTVIYGLTLRKLKPGEIVKYTGAVHSPVWDISAKGRYTLKVKYESKA
ncbi:MAG TPA: hypothetical protein VN673_18570, partial [Clostridia bacterium]|nr:hypothetical protein [Clostridia bacterium]